MGGSSWRSGGAGGTAEVAMNHTKQAVLDTCVAGLAGQQVLEQTMEHMKENWPDVRRARVALRQLDAVAKCMEKQATTMACKIGMSMALKHRKKMQCQQPAAVAQTPLRQVTNFIADSSSASSTKKRAVCKSQSRIDRDVAPSMLQFTSPRVLRPRPVLEKPRPDAGKMYTARTAVKYMHQRSQNDKKWRKCNVAAELVRDRLVPVHRDNLLNRYNLFAESIQKGCQVEAALDQVRPFHDRGRPLLVDKQECIEFARSMAHHDRAISEGDVASFLTNARKRKAEKAGKDASMCRQVCPKTVHGYLQVFEDMPGEIKVHGSVQEKPLRRLVAEQSLMSSVTFVTTVAASHFIPVADAAAADVPPADNVLARKMQEYMDKNGGGYFRCVLPNLVLNLDATTLLVHTRKTKTGKEWYASSVDDTGKRRSIFTPGTSSPDCPQWLTLIKGISGAGCTLRWAIVMKGIPESELPGDKVADGVHVVPVAGWGLGSGVNRDVAGEGYVIFVRGDQEGCLKIVYEWYMERIVLPFISHERNLLLEGQGGWTPRQPVPVWLRGVVWLDGEMNQLASVIQPDWYERWHMLDTHVCKVPAASTATKNVLDVSPIFRSLKTLEKNLNAADFDSIKAQAERFERLLKQVHVDTCCMREHTYGDLLN